MIFLKTIRDVLNLKKARLRKTLLSLLLIGILNSAAAQLCNGSLGDPVIHITFGAGFGFAPPLDPSVTTYAFIYNTCPTDGHYTLASHTDTCFGTAWHSIDSDHTANDVGGNMMIINAAANPGDIYVDTVRDLCSETTYEFAAWVLNVLKLSSCDNGGIRPNLTFKIESITGNVLSSVVTGDIVARTFPAWEQFGLSFTTPAGANAVVMRIIDNAPGGCGNDFILDDITFRTCGPTVSITVDGSSNNKDICIGNTSSYNFSGFIEGSIPLDLQWQTSTDSATWVDIPGETTDTYFRPAITTVGSYFFRLTASKPGDFFKPSCRFSSHPIKITVYDLPAPSATNNGPICENNNVLLSATGGTQYEWSGPNNYISNLKSPIISNIPFSSNGKYYVKVTSFAGCVNTDSTVVVVNKTPAVDAGNNVTICEGTNTKLLGTTAATNSWSWSPSGNLVNPSSLTPVASPAKTTLYTLTVYDRICTNSDTVLVTVIPKPVANAGPDKSYIGNQSITLDGQASGSNIYYYWTPNYFIFPDSVLNPKVSPPFDTTYTLHVVSKDGCGVATDQVFIKHYKDIYVPNSFTPNNDGKNDNWGIPLLSDFPSVEIKVYNRFGQLIFHNKGNTKKWDGTFKGMAQPGGVYCYTIDLKNGFPIMSGVVILIR